jgi:hypothetical protein
MKLTISILLALVVISCKENVTNPSGINTNIVLVESSGTGNTRGDYRMGVWYNEDIFCVTPLRKLTINSQNHVVTDLYIADSLVGSLNGYGYRFFNYLSINKSGTKLVIVMSTYEDVSVGDLAEVDLQTWKLRVLRDSSYNISSAVYSNSDSSCIYYTYGNPGIGLRPGYYRYDFLTTKETIIFPYISEVGPAEVVNGFDISPNGEKLLVPLNHWALTPNVIEYDLNTKTVDTLRVNFKRQFLWLRYNSDATQILYSNYARGSGGSSVENNSEVGIIDMESVTKKILDVNTNPGGTSVNFCPNWSPDNRSIVYGSARGPLTEPPGGKEAYSLYILKNIHYTPTILRPASSSSAHTMALSLSKGQHSVYNSTHHSEDWMH